MKPKFSRIYQMLVNGILILLTFLYVYKFVDPLVINFKQQPSFLSGAFFFNNYNAYPGGIIEYISLFFSQFYGSKFLGSVIITLIVFASVFVSRWLLLKVYKSTIVFILQYIPFIALIILLSNYSINLKCAIAFILAIGLSATFLSFKNSALTVKLAVLLPLIVAFYYLTGAVGIITFVLTIITAEFILSDFKKSSLIALLATLTAALTIYFFTLKSPYISFRNAFEMIDSKTIGNTNTLSMYVLYGFIPVSMLINLLLKQLKTKSEKSIIENRFFLIGCSVVILGAALTTFYLSFDSQEKKRTQLHLFAQDAKWDNVLKLGKELPKDDRKVLFEINRALYHKNQLLDKAFSFEQYYGEHGLILTTHYNSQVLMFCSDLYRDMGHIKESTHWAYEAETKYSYAPIVLKRIIENNIIMGNYPVAEKFLNILSKSCLHKSWVKKYRGYLNNEKAVEANPEFALMRRLKPKQDFFANIQNPQSDLVKLFEENGANKMAFEYFILYGLMQHNLALVVKQINQFEKMGYTKLPAHVEEALLLFQALNDKAPADMGNYSISQETINRFMGYSKVLMRFKGNKKAAQSELKKEFGNTYWYYVYYVSPITNKREIKTING